MARTGIILPSTYNYFGARQPNSGPVRLIFRFLNHTIRHTDPVGLLRTSDQTIAEAATYKTQNKHNIRTFMPSAGFEPVIQAAADLHLRTHDHRDIPPIY